MKTIFRIVLIPVVIFSLLLPGCREEKASADLVLYNANIYTVDNDFSVAEAIAISGNTIIAVGTEEELENYLTTATKTIDLHGKTVLPGLIDAHAHLLGYAASLDQLDLAGTTSEEQIAVLVKEKAATLAPGEWITGRGWDQNDWEIKEFPERALLDEAAPDNPVFLRRVDGHAAWSNGAALEIAGITSETVSPSGGEIISGPDGDPTGVFIDRAMGLIRTHIPDVPDEQHGFLLRRAVNNCLAAGLTGSHEMGGSSADVEIVKEQIASDSFPFRLYFLQSANLATLGNIFSEGKYDYEEKLFIRGVKAYADGALGSRGAALLEPYSDRPDSVGLMITDKAELQEITELCLANGFQVCTHAIGDAANRATLDAYQAALANVPSRDPRLRIEHAQILSLDDIPRFAEMNVLPSMQPTHCTSDLPWAIDRVGEERIKGAYAWRKLRKTGVIIPCGSDFPVEEINPFHGLYSAVTRKHQDGLPESGYFPAEVLEREEALRGFTIWAAYAGFMEDIVGSLEVGKRADLIMIDRDIMKVSEFEIFSTRVLATLFDGNLVYGSLDQK